ncbi:MAG: NHL repeat-containing protein, partial [Candidatus Omnitrophota bacterium]
MRLIAILVVECFIVTSIAPDYYIRSLLDDSIADSRQLKSAFGTEAPDFLVPPLLTSKEGKSLRNGKMTDLHRAKILAVVSEHLKTEEREINKSAVQSALDDMGFVWLMADEPRDYNFTIDPGGEEGVLAFMVEFDEYNTPLITQKGTVSAVVTASIKTAPVITETVEQIVPPAGPIESDIIEQKPLDTSPDQAGVVQQITLPVEEELPPAKPIAPDMAAQQEVADRASEEAAVPIEPISTSQEEITPLPSSVAVDMAKIEEVALSEKDTKTESTVSSTGPVIALAQSFHVPQEEFSTHGIPDEWEDGMYMDDSQDSILNQDDIDALAQKAEAYSKRLERKNLPPDGKEIDPITDAHRRKYGFRIFEVKGRLFFIQTVPGEDMASYLLCITSSLSAALGHKDLASLDRSKPFVIIRPQRSERLFGDCLVNHVMYINRGVDKIYAQLDSQQVNSGDVLLGIGLEHELYHEVSGKADEIEPMLRERDTRRFVELSRNNDVMLWFLARQGMTDKQFEADCYIRTVSDPDIKAETRQHCIEVLGGLLVAHKLLASHEKVVLSSEQLDTLIGAIPSGSEALKGTLAYAISRALVNTRELRINASQLRILLECLKSISSDPRASARTNVLLAISSALANNEALLEPIISFYETDTKALRELLWTIGSTLEHNEKLIQPAIDYFMACPSAARQEFIHVFYVALARSVRFSSGQLDAFIREIPLAPTGYGDRLIAVVGKSLEINKELKLNPSQLDMLIQRLSKTEDIKTRGMLAGAIGYALLANEELTISPAQFEIMLNAVPPGGSDKVELVSTGKFAFAITHAIKHNKMLTLTQEQLEVFINGITGSSTEETKRELVEFVITALEQQEVLEVTDTQLSALMNTLYRQEDALNQRIADAVGIAVSRKEEFFKILFGKLKRASVPKEQKLTAYAIGIAASHNEDFLSLLFSSFTSAHKDNMGPIAEAIAVCLEHTSGLKFTAGWLNTLIKSISGASSDSDKARIARAISACLKNNRELILSPEQVEILLRALSAVSSESDKISFALCLKQAAENDKAFKLSSGQWDIIVKVIPAIKQSSQEPLSFVLGIAMAHGEYFRQVKDDISWSRVNEAALECFAGALGVAMAHSDEIRESAFKELYYAKPGRSMQWLTSAIGVSLLYNESLLDDTIEKLYSSVSNESREPAEYAIGLAAAQKESLYKALINKIKNPTDKHSDLNYYTGSCLGIAMSKREDLFEAVMQEFLSAGVETKKWFGFTLGVTIAHNKEFLEPVLTVFKTAPDNAKKQIAYAIYTAHSRLDNEPILKARGKDELFEFTPSLLAILIEAVSAASYDTRSEIATSVASVLERNKKLKLTRSQLDIFIQALARNPGNDRPYSLTDVVGIAISRNRSFFGYFFGYFNTGNEQVKEWVVASIKNALKENQSLKLSQIQFTSLLDALLSVSRDNTMYEIAYALGNAVLNDHALLSPVIDTLNTATTDQARHRLSRALDAPFRDSDRSVKINAIQLDVLMRALKPAKTKEARGGLGLLIETALAKNPKLKLLTLDQLDILIQAAVSSDYDTNRSIGQAIKTALENNKDLVLDQGRFDALVKATSQDPQYPTQYFMDSIDMALKRNQDIKVDMGHLSLLIKTAAALEHHSDIIMTIVRFVIGHFEAHPEFKLDASHLGELKQAMLYSRHSDAACERIAFLMGVAVARSVELLNVLFTIFDSLYQSEKGQFISALCVALEKNEKLTISPAQLDSLLKNFFSIYDSKEREATARAVSLALRNDRSLKLSAAQIDFFIQFIKSGRNPLRENISCIRVITNALLNDRGFVVNASQWDILLGTMKTVSDKDVLLELSRAIGMAVANSPELLKPLIEFKNRILSDVKFREGVSVEAMPYFDSAIGVALAYNGEILSKMMHAVRYGSDDERAEDAFFIAQALSDNKTFILTPAQLDSLIFCTSLEPENARFQSARAVNAALVNDTAAHLTMEQVSLLMRGMSGGAKDDIKRELASAISSALEHDSALQLTDALTETLIGFIVGASANVQEPLARAIYYALIRNKQIKPTPEQLNIIVGCIISSNEESAFELARLVRGVLENNKELKLTPSQLNLLIRGIGKYSKDDTVQELISTVNAALALDTMREFKLDDELLKIIIKKISKAPKHLKKGLARILINTGRGDSIFSKDQVELLMSAIPDIGDEDGSELAFIVCQCLSTDKDANEKLTEPLIAILFNALSSGSEKAQVLFALAITFLCNTKHINVPVTNAQFEILLDAFVRSSSEELKAKLIETVRFVLYKNPQLKLTPEQIDALVQAIPESLTMSNLNVRSDLADIIGVILKNERQCKLNTSQVDILIKAVPYMEGEVAKENIVGAIGNALSNDVNLLRHIFDAFDAAAQGADKETLAQALGVAVSIDKTLFGPVIELFEAGTEASRAYLHIVIGKALANPDTFEDILGRFKNVSDTTKKIFADSVLFALEHNEAFLLDGSSLDLFIATLSQGVPDGVKESVGSVIAVALHKSPTLKFTPAQTNAILQEISLTENIAYKTVLGKTLQGALHNDPDIAFSLSQLDIIITNTPHAEAADTNPFSQVLTTILSTHKRGLEYLGHIITYFETENIDELLWLVTIVDEGLKNNKNLSLDSASLDTVIRALSRSTSDVVQIVLCRIVDSSLTNDKALKLTTEGQLDIFVQGINRASSYAQKVAFAEVLKTASINDEALRLSADQTDILIRAIGDISMYAFKPLSRVIGIALSNNRALLVNVVSGFSIPSYRDKEKEWIAEALSISIVKNRQLIQFVMGQFIKATSPDVKKWIALSLGRAIKKDQKILDAVFDIADTLLYDYKEAIAEMLGNILSENPELLKPIFGYYASGIEAKLPKDYTKVKSARKLENLNMKEPYGVVLLPNGKLAVTNSGDNSIRIIDPTTGKELDRFDKDTGLDLNGPLGIALVDGNLAVTNSGDNSIRIIDPTTGKELRRFDKDTGLDLDNPVDIILINGNLVVVSYNDQSIRIINPATGEELRRFGKDTGLDLNNPTGITLVNGNLAVVSYNDQSIRIIDPATGKELDRFGKDTGLELNKPEGITLVDGNLAVTNSGDNSICIIDPKTGKELDRFGKDTGLDLKGPVGITVVEDNLVVMNLEDSSISIIEFEDMISSKPQPPKDYIKVNSARKLENLNLDTPHGAVMFSNGTLAVTNKGNNSISIIDPATGKELRRFGKDTGLDLNDPDGIIIFEGILAVTNSLDDSIILIDPATGKELRRFGKDTGL